MPALDDLRRLRFIFVAEDYRQFGLLVACMLVGAALQVTGVASILPFMQLAAQPGIVEQNTWMGRLYELGGFGSEREMLLVSGIVVFALFTGSVLATALTGYVIQRSIWRTAHRLCVRQLKIYMQMPYEFFLVTSSAELLRRIVADVNKLLSDVLLAGSLLLAQLATATALFVLLLLVNPRLSIAAFAGFGAAYVVLHLLRHRLLVRLGTERIDTDNRRYTTFMDAISGMKAIRVANASGFFVERFEHASQDYAAIYPRLDLATNVPRYVMEILAFGGIILVVLLYVATEETFASVVPLLSVFALATYRLMPALHTIFDSAAKLSNSLPVIRSVARDMRPERPLEPAVTAPPAPLPYAREIRFGGASFRYERANREAVDAVGIVIRKGQRVALVGATGSGKTTLADIMVGLLIPTTGALEIDGVPVTPENVARWRQIVAYVPQEVFLYDDSIAQNIAFGVAGEAVDEVRLRAAARAAQLDAFITNELDEGYAPLPDRRAPERRAAAAPRPGAGPVPPARRAAARRGHERARHRHRGGRDDGAARGPARGHGDHGRAPPVHGTVL